MSEYSNYYGDYNKAQQLKKAKAIKKALDLKDKTLLDVACGDASYYSVFEHYMGVDDSPENIIEAGEADVVLSDVRKTPFEDKNFDVVMCISSIYRSSDYKKILFEIKRLSREYVVLSILKDAPNYNEFSSFLEQNFNIRKIIEEQKDLIFICTIN